MEIHKNFKIKKDQYRQIRGGTSYLLEISCTNCNEVFAIYQKDGPGALLRTYLDRFLWPDTLALLHETITAQNYKEAGNLICTNCNEVIGVPMLYKKEKRPAFNMNPLKFHKKRV